MANQAVSVQPSAQEESRILRISVRRDCVYVPYYYNCMECDEPMMTEDERMRGTCKTCRVIDEMETA